MTKEQEIMNYLHEKVFEPTLNSKTCPSNIKSGVNLTIGRMNRLSAKSMVKYFWSALSTDNAIEFSNTLRSEGLTRFEDVKDEFGEKFNNCL